MHRVEGMDALVAIENMNECIKQLVQNSIDAHSTKIQVKLDGFNVKVVDNGDGMSLQLIGDAHVTPRVSIYALGGRCNLDSFSFMFHSKFVRTPHH